MNTPLRILRAQAEDLRTTPVIISEREASQRQDILARGRVLLARNGRHLLTFSSLAMALKISAGTLRRHFADIEALMGEILTSHLRAVMEALAEVPADAPNRQYHLCAAYYGATRGAFSSMTEAHLIFTRDRHLLPDDVIEPIDALRHGLAEILAGPAGDPSAGIQILDLLDMPMLVRTWIAPMLAYVAATQAPAVEVPALPAKLTTVKPPEMHPETAAYFASDDVLSMLHPKGLGEHGACFEPLQGDAWPPAPPPTVHRATET